MWNNISGSIPKEIGTIIALEQLLLSGNQLWPLSDEVGYLSNLKIFQLDLNLISGSIPKSFVNLPKVQHLDLSKNQLTGNIPVNRLSNNITTINFQNNILSDISGVLEVPPIVTLMLHENPICLNFRLHENPICLSATQSNISLLCGSDNRDEDTATVVTYPVSNCPSSCPPSYEYIPGLPADCFYAIPFELFIDSQAWEEGQRLRMFLKFFPQLSNDSHEFNKMLLPSLKDKGMSKGTLAGIVLGSVFCASVVLLGVIHLFLKKNQQLPLNAAKDKSLGKVSIIIDGVKAFSFKELQAATSRFSIATQVGRGGYGKVFKGTLTDGTIVAIKRTQQGSLQGEKEFYTEMEMLSR
ncbi:probable LRR receptor-like serine threonine-kinase At1g06840 isoform X1 [Olea europaea subsp. europaea]|uniref:Probable LRR receptor-like serine threonine-kinase At1g06840 isoform X1 n=1 Tax=Olea europaea subsp. europaea TaxID=158383 RepID=A0A8S0U0Q6_OLEEU|nr:probable LRR receptor-like serine threonine-kinase At1g06840 isoform X1 [Olea europaea subsp. europaea]